MNEPEQRYVDVSLYYSLFCVLQEDVYNGSLLAEVLTYRPTSVPVLANASCLVANLASDEISQVTMMLTCLLLWLFPLAYLLSGRVVV